jgi:hypothetical protein
MFHPRHFFCLLGFLLAGLDLVAQPAAESPLAGHWQIDLSRSTDLSPWKTYNLEITVHGDSVTFNRELAWGRREFADAMTVDLSRTDNVIAVEMWPDNRHLGAYIGGDREKHVHAAWVGDRRILRLSTDLVLATQQGSRSVNILSNYQVSANGAQLTLTELRSTRHRPIVYVFTRAPAPPP